MDPQESRPGAGRQLGSDDDRRAPSCAFFVRQYVRTDECGVLASERLRRCLPLGKCRALVSEAARRIRLSTLVSSYR
ncbi:hypothetical protein QFZ55_002912 [Streptomyces luteogriseus]|nr:hypothetical protein [Streptomyces luteogriseus]